jgi:hypothetical protein
MQDQAEIGRVVGAFADAMAQEDFEGACDYFSRAARAWMVALACATGLETDSCATALSHLLKQANSVDARTLASMWERMGGLAFEVELQGADRATVTIDTSPSLGSAELIARLVDDLRLTMGIPLVREDGNWKLGLRYVDDEPHH